MNLTDEYNHLWEKSLTKFKAGEFELDPFIDSPDDNRFGITLLLRPDRKTKEKIGQFLQELQKIEPEQYYYPTSDIHVTIMSIISCYPGFDLENIEVNQYTSLFKNLISNMKPIEIAFNGITASPSCILVQGFPSNNLNDLRNRIRASFKSSQHFQSIDKRYSIRTAHCTVARFKSPLKRNEEFIKQLIRCKNADFGVSKIDEVELVYNDWYQRKNKVKVLSTFSLK